MRDAPSSTALLVAAGVAFQSTHPKNRHLVPEQAGRLLRDFVQGRNGASRFDRFVVALRERLTVPGLTLHYVLRKKRIEELVRKGGFRQLIVLGAGLDTLALRLSREMTCIEIDHPATQNLKAKLLDCGGHSAALELLPVDFTKETMTDALKRSSRYRPNEPALFIAESVLLYLTESEVRNLFAQLKARPAATRLIFTFWEPRTPINFQNATFIADWYLRKHGEPGRWAIAPEKLREFLESEGFTLVELIRDVEYGTSARGEHIATATHPGSSPSLRSGSQ
jgi:methyltransferase (TIGR00027 family)